MKMFHFLIALIGNKGQPDETLESVTHSIVAIAPELEIAIQLAIVKIREKNPEPDESHYYAPFDASDIDIPVSSPSSSIISILTT